jgi:hypothetical protein
MNSPSSKKYMRCIECAARGAPVRTGSYSPVIAIDGSAPHRTATIVDAWGTPRPVCEDEDGRWQLSVRDYGHVAELVFA